MVLPDDSYLQFQVQLGTQNRMYQRSEKGTLQIIECHTLKDVPGFRPGSPNLFMMKYCHKEHPSYHAHTGGYIWMPTVPVECGHPGQRMSVLVKTLTEKDFVRNIPSFSMGNKSNLPWLPLLVTVRHVTLEGQRVCLGFLQQPAIEGTTHFDIRGVTSEPLGFHSGTASLRFEVRAGVEQRRLLAI